MDDSLAERPETVDEEHKFERAPHSEDVVQEVLAQRAVEVQIEVVAGSNKQENEESHHHKPSVEHLGADVPGKQDVEVPQAQEGVLLDVALNGHLDEEAVEGEDPQVSAHRAFLDLVEDVVEEHEERHRVGQAHQQELQLAPEKQVVLSCPLQVHRVGVLVKVGQLVLEARHVGDDHLEDLVLLRLEQDGCGGDLVDELRVVVLVQRVQPQSVEEEPGRLETPHVYGSIFEDVTCQA